MVSVLAPFQIMAFIPVHDFARARVFYEGVLGLQFVRQDVFAVVLDFNGTPVRIVKIDRFTPHPFTILGWLVPDITAAAEALAARGIEFIRFPYLKHDATGIWRSDAGDQVAWFHDPDGNTLSISQLPDGVATMPL